MADDLRHWVGGSGFVRPRAGPARPARVEGKAIFLSHATPDKRSADELCRLIEAQGVGCWIAPRDIAPGDDYAQSIIRAIEETAVTILLLSAHSNESVHVTNEIERATSKRKRVVPVRLENLLPNQSLELHLSRTQWIDAWTIGMEQVALQLVRSVKGEAAKPPAPSAGPAPPAPPAAPSSDSRPIRIVPKGLRSFDAHDADFFLELLPGPRDRDGLPDSIRFWKTRIEETDADNTFAVGLIYGPSGCGKSSFVKAGLLPRLSQDIIPVYVEATADETEARLLAGLRKRCPSLPANLDLTQTLAALRRGQGAAAGEKVLIVLDQFEQWLHAKKEETNTELVQALRQCDGGRVQCIVMVRDDFWLAVSRFLRELEIRLLEGHNSALADLFDLDHARKVLTAFGRAYGKLPEQPGDKSDDEKEFLRQAVAGLSQEGKVISVRLALFADMMKSRPWTPASLKEVGGAQGVGETFLEETFSAATAPPEHRYHQKAARAVLKALLPESGTDIKGNMRSYAELLEASGYAGRPKEFDELVRILDSEIRLLTPTDPEGHEGAEGVAVLPLLPSPGNPGEGRVRVFAAPTDRLHPASLIEESPSPQPSPGVPGEGEDVGGRPPTRYYQLTHDYLVPSMRDWLTRKQKETRRGRAELLLADRAGVWNARPENRQLPSLRQWLSIRWLTKKKAWTPPQRKMMKSAGRHHAARGTAFILLAVLATSAGFAIRRRVLEQQAAERREATEIAALADALMHADARQFSEVFPKLAAYGDRGASILAGEIDRTLPPDAGDDAKENLAKRQANAAVALLLMGKPAKVWPVLKHSPDPRARSYLIHRLGPFGVDPVTIVRRIDGEPDVTIRRALVLSLGQFDERALPVDRRKGVADKLLGVYRGDPDPGLHAAAEWLLRRWGQAQTLEAVDAALRQDESQLRDSLKSRLPPWWVNSKGHTMVVIPGPVEFDMGSPAGETDRQSNETQHRMRIGRTFAIASKPVTVAQYRQSAGAAEVGDHPDMPATNVSWYDAAGYCNWLSKEEGISPDQWCYEAGAQGNTLAAKKNFLALSGYRLPTEAEMEYATRAGASTSRYYGQTAELLPEYAWYDANSESHPWPPGTKKPNDFGLFDMHGNMWCWCQDYYQEYAKTTGDGAAVDVGGPPEGNIGVLRGGSFDSQASVVRCACRGGVVPADRAGSDGFRPARTLPLVSLTPLPPAEGAEK